MLMVISPAKSLDEAPRNPALAYSQADFLAQSAELVEVLRELGPQDLSQLMHISDDLAELNYQRNQAWCVPSAQDSTSKQALMMFKGDVYLGLDAASLDLAGLEYAQTHLRILSGLYGLLRPLDLMQPYRLEMGTKLMNAKGKDLYAFWANQLTEAVNALLPQTGKPLVNLASNEYFKAIKPRLLQTEVITPQFKDWKNGQYKMISFFAKRARGLMVRYAIDHQVEQVEDLKYFDYDGYRFAAELSGEKDWVFTRKQG
ncbi:MAG: peroxide stress protein YaaA [Thiomicrospira sp.]|jgi:cytoplasmic iron level regulating protein YaaA (DUF328/UPF0246 family)|nr:peroxide stress protein YaaA [Thiomicrospira sp.]